MQNEYRRAAVASAITATPTAALMRSPLPTTVAKVDGALPIIYTTRRTEAARLRIGPRVLALAAAGACLTVLLVAAYATPNPSGVGTHVSSLHMQPCNFLQTTHLPCPGCGMTTSFAWFVRGNLLASVYVQPMGAMLAAICCACVWTGAYVAFTGRPVYRLFRLLPGRYYLLPLLALGVLAWGWKIMLRLNNWDGW